MLTRNQTLLVNSFPIAFELSAPFLTCSELYNLLFSCKEGFKWISRRAIVETVMCNGNENQRRTIEELYELTSVGSIYNPSSVRVIRLVCALRCEKCFVNKVNHVRAGFGLAICWDCTLSSSSLIVPRIPNQRRLRLETDDILRNPRVAAKLSKKVFPNPYQTSFNGSWGYYAWKNHFIMPCVLNEDRYERVGPIVTLGDIHTISSFNRPDEMHSYINTTLCASPMKEYAEFNDAVRENRYLAFPVIQSRKMEKKNTLIKTRMQRIEDVKRIVAKLQPFLNTRMKQVVMMYDVNANYTRYRCAKYHACILFHDSRVQHFMYRYVLSPSKMRTRRKLKELAEQLNTVP